MSNIKKGTLTKGGKPTRFVVELYLKYFEFGGHINDVRLNEFAGRRLKEIMGWENGQGLVCLRWGINPKTANCKKHNYRDPMVVAKNIAWDIHLKCN